MANSVPGQMDPSALTWNIHHTVNEEHSYCYCGRDRSLLEPNIQCRSMYPFHSLTFVAVNSPFVHRQDAEIGIMSTAFKSQSRTHFPL
jgi:hypothetical protein